MKTLMTTTLTALAVAGSLFAADPTPAQKAKETYDALTKECHACIKTDAKKAADLRIKALQTPNLEETGRLINDIMWDFKVISGNLDTSAPVMEAVIASPLSKPGQKLDALTWLGRGYANKKNYAESRRQFARARILAGVTPVDIRGLWVLEAEGYVDENAAEAGKNAMACYEKAFAIKDGSRREYDIVFSKAIDKLAKNHAALSQSLCDRLLADPDTTSEYRYSILMRLANNASKANKRDDLYKYALQAQKVPGKFDKMSSYLVLATYEFEQRRWSRHADPDQWKLYMKWIDAAYEAGVKDMGLTSEQASAAYLKAAETVMWHYGRPDKDSKLARQIFEKAISLGAKKGTGGIHWGSYDAVKSRLEDLEAKEAEFATFPRDWRKIDGVYFAELEKKLDAGKTVHAKDFGTWNDTDVTEMLQKAVDSDATCVIVDKMNGPWEIEQLVIPSNKKVLLKKGVVLEARKGGILKAHSLIGFSGEGMMLIGEGDNEIRMRKEDYMKDKKLYPSFDDNRHGIDVRKRAVGFLVRNVKISSSGGDGVCLTSSSRVWLDRVDLWNNVRQALTIGTGAYKVYLTDCKFDYTWGGEPMSGIDIENWTENCTIGEIYCENCEFANNRIYGLVLATSTYTPMSMYYKNCEFRNNGSSSLSILNRPGVPTKNREIFENCRFLQARCVTPINYVRTLIGNITFKNCLIKEIPGGNESGTASPITIGLDPDMSDFYIGENVFENVKIEGYEGAELIAMLPRASGTEFIKDGAFKGVVDFNGKQIDIAKYIKDRGLDKPAPKYVPATLDYAKLAPPKLDTAVDAYLPAPFGMNINLGYWAEKDRTIQLGYFHKLSCWSIWSKGRYIKAKNAKGEVTNVALMDYTNDYSNAYFTVPETGFYEFSAVGRGFWSPADDKVWGYFYRSSSGDGFAAINNNSFTGFFEVPEGVKEITIQTRGGRSFELVDAANVTMAKNGPTQELKTWVCKVDHPGIWRFFIDHGQIRFFAPLNGIFADQPANLPMLKK